jgi:membrane protein YdbS with pleckstrin-like domain
MTSDPVAPDNLPPQPHETVAAPDKPVKKSERGPLDDKPDDRAEARGTTEEVEIWVGRTHWKHYAGRLFVWGAGNLAFAIAVIWIASRTDRLGFAGTFWLITGALAITGLLVVGRILLIVLGHRYRVTNQRLFIERGIVSQTVDQTELIRVDDVRLYKSFLDRVFGLGSVAVVSTDATDKEILLEGVPGPDKVAESIRANMRILRQKSLFIENL